jgi:hypothetical protein
MVARGLVAALVKNESAVHRDPVAANIEYWNASLPFCFVTPRTAHSYVLWPPVKEQAERF